jgi:hypothetical protein
MKQQKKKEEATATLLLNMYNGRRSGQQLKEE